MPRPSFPRNPSSGFILLHALWLLLAASAAIAGLLVLTSRRSEEFAAAERQVQMELAQESAAESVIYDLVSRGAGSPWLHAPLATATISVDGQPVTVTVRNVAGMLDPATVDGALLSEIFGRVLGTAGHSAVERIEAARTGPGRPFSSYAELRATTGLSDHAFACLYPYLTLFSGQTAPDPRLAPSELITMLRHEQGGTSAISPTSGSASPAGATYRIEASIAIDHYRSQLLTIEVTITGGIRPSHLVRSWQFRPREDGCPGGSRREAESLW